MRRAVWLAVFLGVMPIAASAEDLIRVRIEADDARALAARFQFAGYDVLEGGVTDSSVELIVTEAELTGLREEGHAPTILARSRPFREIQAEPDGTGSVPPGYPDLQEIVDELTATAAAFPDICQLVDVTSTYGSPATFEGRHLYAVKISDNVGDDEDEPTYLLVSGHHCREIVTPVIALHAIEQLTTRYGIDPEITALVDDYEIWIAPTWNPDGYVYVFEVNNFWRKNRRIFSQGVGVDLNRNYPFGWDSPCGGSTSVTSETYRGPEPASEAETQTMIALGEDRRFAKVADYHSFGREVRYGYGCWNHPFLSFLESEAHDLSVASGYGGIGPSCCTAGNIHFHMGTKGSHAFLWETHTDFQPSYASAQAEAAQLFGGVLFFLQRPIPLSGHVTDAFTGLPVVADVSYAGVLFQNGEENASGGQFGRYHAFLPPGSYTVVFSAEGYVNQSFGVTVTMTSAEAIDVLLVREALDDFDLDGDVDLFDHEFFVNCYTGPGGGPIPPPCLPGDADQDDDIDFADYRAFQQVYTGEL